VLTKQLASGKQLPIPLKDLNRFAELFA
jgi:hypothetical protein